MLFSDGRARAVVFRAGLGVGANFALGKAGGYSIAKPCLSLQLFCSILGFRWARVGPILLWTGRPSRA